MQLISPLSAVFLSSSLHVLKVGASEAFVTDTRTNLSYQGVSTNGVDSFLNIRYGQDTSGAGRFAPPIPFIPAPNSVINATANGAACPQQMVPFPGLNGVLDDVTNVSEDCLSLRIARPSLLATDAKLPVMIWIYGGMLSSELSSATKH
jgi:carboxylesterase type B